MWKLAAFGILVDFVYVFVHARPVKAVVISSVFSFRLSPQHCSFKKTTVEKSRETCGTNKVLDTMALTKSS